MSGSGFDSTESTYYLASPNNEVKDTFLYPLIAGSLSYLPGYSLRHRSVDNFMLAYVREGELNIKVAGRLFTVHEHQLLLMNCRNPHDFWTTMPCKDYFVHFDGPTANAYYRYLARNDEVAIIRERTDRVVNSMRGIIDVMSGRTKLAPSSVAHLIDGILTDCDANNEIDRTGNATHIAIERVVSYIAEHLDEDLSIDRLAAIACLSRFYFAKAFREIVGTSPNEYVTRLRVIRAKYLLSLTDLTVLQISKDCGYRSQSTFGAMFKRSIGVTPTEYRSQLIISNLSD